MMNIAYFGSPEIAANLLKALLTAQGTTFKVSIVATQPDRPSGKKLELTKTRVKELGKQNNIPIFDKDIRTHSAELLDLLKQNNIQLCIVFAYGGYIPTSLLDIVKYGFINIHPSLLPKYRGPSPIAYPLILGDKETGVSIIKLNERLDEGDIISQKKVDIFEGETRTELEKRLTEESIELILNYLYALSKQEKLYFQKQEDSKATQTRLINKKNGYIGLRTLKKMIKNEPIAEHEVPELLRDYLAKYPRSIEQEYFTNSALLLYNYYRGLYKWPGLWTIIQTPQGDKRLKLTDISFKLSLITINKVQLEGKNEVDFITFNRAYNIF